MRMRGVIHQVLLLLGVVSGLSGFAVIGYLPEWRYQNTRFGRICQHLSHVILFSSEVLVDGNLLSTYRFPNSTEMGLLQGCAKEYGTKILLGLGGNSRTNGFPIVAQDPNLRKKFIQNLVKFCEEHSLDGVDYNWEYPRGQNEWIGLRDLVRETHEVFREKNWVITLAYYPDTQQESILNQMKISQYIDFYNIMCYDQHDRHSTFEFMEKCVQWGVQQLPREKLALGLPFYSRSVRTGEWKSYSEIYALYKPEPQMNQIQDHYYNGAEMIKIKTEYALSHGLGGVMIWEVGQDLDPDHPEALLQTITQYLAQKSSHEDL